MYCTAEGRFASVGAPFPTAVAVPTAVFEQAAVGTEALSVVEGHAVAKVQEKPQEEPVVEPMAP